MHVKETLQYKAGKKKTGKAAQRLGWGRGTGSAVARAWARPPHLTQAGVTPAVVL